MISLFRSSVKSILALLLLVLSTLPASADRFQYGDLCFETTSENTCEVTYFNNIWGEANYAFTEISIPELAVYNGQFYTVTTIGDDAFSDCSRLTSIVIPNSVTTIGNYAFCGCKDHMSIAIPSSVTKIGNGAFYECMNLTDIYNYALVPQVISLDAFDYVPSSATLHVVKGYKDVYEAAEIWNQFNVVDDLELPTAIGSVTTGAPATEIYTLDGRRADHTANGIVIVRTAEGMTRKVMTK